MKYIKHFSIILILFLVVFKSEAQESEFLPDKPGKFIIQNQLNKCPGSDIVLLFKNLTAIADWIHQNNQVLNPPIGYDASVSFSGNSCDKITDKQDFGVQCLINFSFHYFYIENGVSLAATDWAAHDIEININNPIIQISHQYGETGFQSDDPPHLKQPLEKALEDLQQYYNSAPVEKEIAPGVRLYAGGHLLVFNPGRSDIWIPVTVKEIMEAKLAYYKVKQEIDSIKYVKALAEWAKMNFKPDKVNRPNIYDLIKKEFENFTAYELKQPAFSDSQSGISTINASGVGLPVVRFNPACWNRTLPATAIQFMSLEYKPRSKAELEEFKQDNGGLIDYVGLFINNLPVEKMGELIQRK
jgi:hypothetical protein